jgi:hypothetical protein
MTRGVAPPSLTQEERWRESELLKLGFDPQSAERMAKDPAVRLHDLVRAVQRGCDVDTAYRIFGPDDADGDPS